MLGLIVRQTNWSVIGAIFGFVVGFFIKIYLIDIVGLAQWGKYVSAHTFATTADTLLSLGIPFLIIKFIPSILETDKEKAKKIINTCMQYAIKIPFVFLIVMCFLAPVLDQYVYTNLNDFQWILLLVSVHAPIAIFSGIITSLYRSVFKIKEIMVIGTFVTIPLRAALTFFVFQFTNNILFFVGIELFTAALSMVLMFYFFHKNELPFLFKLKQKEPLEKDLMSYGKKMYFNSLVSFFAGQSLSIILSFTLPSEQIGIYNVLLTITGVAIFLVPNLNKVYAPAIAKLHQEKKFEEMNQLYKKTTFLVNLITLPLSILIIFFAKDILWLYDKSGELSEYSSYLIILMGARIISLLAGSSGPFMVMAGLEKQELQIQSIKAILITCLAILLVKQYELIAIVSLFISFMFFINVAQLFFLYKRIAISPFSSGLGYLVLVSLPLVYFSITHSFTFRFYHYILIPIALYLCYGIVFWKRIVVLTKELQHD